MTTIAPELNLPPDHPLRQILDTIAAHPEVREPVLRVLLTENFLALPEQVRELRVDFTEFREETREQFRIVNARIDETNHSLRERIDETNRSLGERIDETNHSLGERIDETNRSLGERIDETNRQLGETNRQLRENIRSARRTEGHVGRLRGNSYEDVCRYEIFGVMDGWLEKPMVADREPIIERLREARHAGLITRNEYLDALRPDIIARAGDDGDYTGLIAVAEASVTCNRRDLETAARRAELIARFAGVTTGAFVVTNHQWPDALDEAARDLGVNLILHEVPDFAEIFDD